MRLDFGAARSIASRDADATCRRYTPAAVRTSAATRQVAALATRRAPKSYL